MKEIEQLKQEIESLEKTKAQIHLTYFLYWLLLNRLNNALE